MYSAILFILAIQGAVSLAAVHSLGQNGQCLQVSGTPGDGSAVVLGECNENNAQRESTGQQWVSLDLELAAERHPAEGGAEAGADSRSFLKETTRGCSFSVQSCVWMLSLILPPEDR